MTHEENEPVQVDRVRNDISERVIQTKKDMISDKVVGQVTDCHSFNDQRAHANKDKKQLIQA